MFANLTEKISDTMNNVQQGMSDAGAKMKSKASTSSSTSATDDMKNLSSLSLFSSEVDEEDNTKATAKATGEEKGWFSGWMGSQSEEPSMFALTYTQRMLLFLMFVAGGCAMLFLCTMYLSLVLLGQPTKFAITYCLANILLVSSSCFLVGPKSQIKTMFAPVRYVATTVYLSSLMLVLYLVWQLPYYLLIMPAVCMQFAALAWYIASYIPYGQRGLEVLSKFATTMTKKCLSSVMGSKKTSILPM